MLMETDLVKASLIVYFPNTIALSSLIRITAPPKPKTIHNVKQLLQHRLFKMTHNVKQLIQRLERFTMLNNYDSAANLY